MAIAGAQDAGWTVSLNSDTPLAALNIWRSRFGCNGSTIAEKGAVVEMPGGAAVESSDVNRITAARWALEQRTRSSGLAVWSGNPVEALRSDLTLNPAARAAVLINSLSQCSLRYFVRAIALDGSLYQDQSLFREIESQCQDLYPDFDDMVIDSNPDYSLVIVSRAKYTKRLGAQKLINRLRPARVAMIGDSMTDFLGKDVSEHYAVANAAADYKSVADYASSHALTSGVVEILGRLSTR
jgi:hydroxymethylpyrimidine pyrophosphatase-like HAD family hydrolase